MNENQHDLNSCGLSDDEKDANKNSDNYSNNGKSQKFSENHHRNSTILNSRSLRRTTSESNDEVWNISNISFNIIHCIIILYNSLHYHFIILYISRLTSVEYLNILEIGLVDRFLNQIVILLTATYPTKKKFLMKMKTWKTKVKNVLDSMITFTRQHSEETQVFWVEKTKIKNGHKIAQRVKR